MWSVVDIPLKYSCHCRESNLGRTDSATHLTVMTSTVDQLDTFSLPWVGEITDAEISWHCLGDPFGQIHQVIVQIAIICVQ